MFTYCRINRIQRKEEEGDNGIMSIRSEDIIAGTHGDTGFGLEKDQLFLKDWSKGEKARYGHG